MSESPYAIPVEDLLAGARVPESDQVRTRAEAHLPDPDWSMGPDRYLDGGGGDADGD